MIDKQRLLRIGASTLGLLSAGAVLVAGVVFVASQSAQIFVQLVSGKYSALILLAQVLEAVAVVLAAVALSLDIGDTLIGQVWSKDSSTRDVVVLLHRLEVEAEGILIPAITIYSILKVLEFAALPTWPANPHGWVEPVAFTVLILLSLLIHGVLVRHRNSLALRADHATSANNMQG